MMQEYKGNRERKEVMIWRLRGRGLFLGVMGVFLNELVKNGGRNTFEGVGREVTWDLWLGLIVYVGVNPMHSHVKICLSPQWIERFIQHPPPFLPLLCNCSPLPRHGPSRHPLRHETNRYHGMHWLKLYYSIYCGWYQWFLLYYAMLERFWIISSHISI